MDEVILGHDGVLHFSPKERLLEEVVELDLVELSDYEDIDDIIGLEIRDLLEAVGDGYETQVSLALEEALQRLDRVVCFDEDLRELTIYGTGPIDIVELLLVLFSGLQDTERF